MTKFMTIGKSKQFYDFLKNEILSSEYKPGDKFPSIRNLAEKYNISTITVNSVISSLVTEGLLYVEQGRGTFVAERKQDSRKGKKMIGVMLFDFRMENNVEASMFNSIQENLKEDYFVIPYNSYDDINTFYKGLKGFSELEVDGMIVVPPTAEVFDKSSVEQYFNRDIPVVFINRKIPSIKAHFIYMDFEEGIYRAAKHILGQKRKHIALMRHNSPSIAEKMLQGYERAHREEGITVNRKLILKWQADYKNTGPEMASVLDRIDGLIASDYLIYKYKRLFDGKRRIPEDISIVGINDTVYSRFMTPPLTSLPFPSEEIGSEAIRLVIDCIENRIDTLVEKPVLSELIIRSS